MQNTAKKQCILLNQKIYHDRITLRSSSSVTSHPKTGRTLTSQHPNPAARASLLIGSFSPAENQEHAYTYLTKNVRQGQDPRELPSCETNTASSVHRHTESTKPRRKKQHTNRRPISPSYTSYDVLKYVATE